MRVVAILETMYDWREMTSGAGYREAPRYFRINPKNFTGRRLYRLIGPNAQLLVTESCRELVTRANQHGTPDPAWLKENLQQLEPIAVLLVCGKVAQQTFKLCGHQTAAHIIEMPHPAARAYWRKQTIEKTAARIQAALISIPPPGSASQPQTTKG